MATMRSIEIDLDVHKKIELARLAFNEAPNDVLRRLLLIDASLDRGAAHPESAGIGRPWSGKGVTLPHGTELKMEYNGAVYTGQIEDGVWVVEGMTATSPSDAASKVATTREGTKPSLNGWIYWAVKRPTDKSWRPIAMLRGR